MITTLTVLTIAVILLSVVCMELTGELKEQMRENEKLRERKK